MDFTNLMFIMFVSHFTLVNSVHRSFFFLFSKHGRDNICVDLGIFPRVIFSKNLNLILTNRLTETILVWAISPVPNGRIPILKYVLSHEST